MTAVPIPSEPDGPWLDAADEASAEHLREAQLLLELFVGHPAGAAADAACGLLARFRGEDVIVAWSPPTTTADTDSDPVAEAATLAVAAVDDPDLERVTMVTPVRLRDLGTDEVVRRAMVVTSLRRDAGTGGLRDPGRWDMDALLVEVGDWVDDAGGVGVREGLAVATCAERLPVDQSPVGSLLWDTLATRAPGRVGDVVDALGILGFTLLPSSEDRWPTGTAAQRDRVRHRVRRTAAELHQRHAPTALHEPGRASRLPVPVGLPPGFVPACPI